MTDRNKLAETAKAVLLPALGLAAEKFFSGARFEITDQVGYDATVMEAALRPLWGIGPILKDGLTLKVGGREEKAEDIIREIMLRGTDEDDPLCFSKYAERDIVGFANKSATELAGYAVALYFARDLLWEPYTEEQKRRVGGWLSKWASCGLQKSWENNHFWFPLIVLASLERIGVPIPDVCDDVSRAFSVLDSMYMTDGTRTALSGDSTTICRGRFIFTRSFGPFLRMERLTTTPREPRNTKGARRLSFRIISNSSTATDPYPRWEDLSRTGSPRVRSFPPRRLQGARSRTAYAAAR